MRKIQIILVLALLFSQASLSATNEPNHPLSQINPIDQDFNLENHQILNLSMMRLNDGSGSTGLIIDDYTIRDSGNLNPLRLDTSNGKWVIDKSTDLDLTGSNVLDINEINPGGQALTLGGQMTLQGDIAMGSNNIDTSGLVDGVDLDNPGNAVIVDGSNRYAVAQNSIGNGELNNADSFTISGLTMNGNINLNGYNMTGIDVLHFQSGMAINGSINTTGGDVNLGGGDIHDVGAIDGGGAPVEFNDGIDMNSNSITEISGLKDSNGVLRARFLDTLTQINTPGGGSEEVAIRDTANSQFIARFNEGGKVEIPNGELVMSGNRINMGGGNIAKIGSIKANGPTLRIDTRGNGGDSVEIYDTANSQSIAQFNEGGDLEIPNGRLGIQTVGTPSRPLVVNGSSIFHGTLSMSNNAMDGVGAVRINDVGEGEGLDFGGGKVISVSTSGQGNEDAFEIQTDATYPVEIETRDANGAETDRLSVTTGVNQADIDITNADIDLNGNSVTSSSGEVCIGDQCT